MLTTNSFHQTVARSLKRLTGQLRAMSSDRKDHLDLTSDQYRDPHAVPARIVSVTDLSSTVKGLELHVDKKFTDGGLQFKPGQWMDFFIPRLEQVGGFSMYSSPSALKTSGRIELAIKRSSWSPAKWVHTECQVGDWVTFRFGGDFYYPPPDLRGEHSLLLIAGGVGINPLQSILRHSSELMSAGASGGPSEVSLLYTAARAEELLFREEISELCSRSERIRAQYFVTKERTGSEGFTERRMRREDLENILSKSENSERQICYLCGPPGMVEQVRDWLVQLNVSAENIKYELWW